MDFEIISLADRVITIRHVVEFHEWRFGIAERDGHAVLAFEAEAEENPLASCSAKLLQHEAYAFAHKALRRQKLIEA